MDEDNIRFAKLSVLTLGTGQKAISKLTELFLRKENTSFPDVLDGDIKHYMSRNCANRKCHLDCPGKRTQHTCTSHQWKTLYKRKKNTSCHRDCACSFEPQQKLTLYDIDLCLSIVIILSIFPTHFSNEERTSICKLREYRNNIAHKRNAKLNETEFSTWWAEVEASISNLARKHSTVLYEELIQEMASIKDQTFFITNHRLCQKSDELIQRQIDVELTCSAVLSHENESASVDKPADMQDAVVHTIVLKLTLLLRKDQAPSTAVIQKALKMTIMNDPNLMKIPGMKLINVESGSLLIQLFATERISFKEVISSIEKDIYWKLKRIFHEAELQDQFPNVNFDMSVIGQGFSSIQTDDGDSKRSVRMNQPTCEKTDDEESFQHDEKSIGDESLTDQGLYAGSQGHVVDSSRSITPDSEKDKRNNRINQPTCEKTDDEESFEQDEKSIGDESLTDQGLYAGYQGHVVDSSRSITPDSDKDKRNNRGEKHAASDEKADEEPLKVQQLIRKFSHASSVSSESMRIGCYSTTERNPRENLQLRRSYKKALMSPVEVVDRSNLSPESFQSPSVRKDPPSPTSPSSPSVTVVKPKRRQFLSAQVSPMKVVDSSHLSPESFQSPPATEHPPSSTIPKSPTGSVVVKPKRKPFSSAQVSPVEVCDSSNLSPESFQSPPVTKDPPSPASPKSPTGSVVVKPKRKQFSSGSQASSGQYEGSDFITDDNDVFDPPDNDYSAQFAESTEDAKIRK